MTARNDSDDTAGTDAPPQATEQLSTVVVKGSRILREGSDTPAPLQIITSEDIANTGYTSTAQLFQALTTNGEGNLNQGFSGAFAAGASGIALRGMSARAAPGTLRQSTRRWHPPRTRSTRHNCSMSISA
jgi:outer membrane cobalamin receptor